MPIDPLTIVLTALPFVLGGRGVPPIKSADIDAEGNFSFEYGNTAGLRGARERFLEEARLLEQRLTAHIREGAPLPDEFYSGRQSTPYWRELYRQVRADVVAARDDFVSLQEPEEPEDFPDGEPYAPVRGGEQITPVGPEDYFVPRFVRRVHTSIPGGLAGFSQQTAVGQMQLTGRAPPSRVRRARRARPVKAAARSRSRSRVNGRKPRPGTKAWMTYIRGLRKKR